MEVDMLGNAILAFNNMMSLERLGFLSFGVLIGLVLGVIPGLGGLVGLSLLLPFTFNMDPYTALAFMMGLQAVVVTSDTIPAVLFGVPGTVGSAATILDGYPMARKGEAGRAFGAAFSASVIGGLFGVLSCSKSGLPNYWLSASSACHWWRFCRVARRSKGSQVPVLA
jgi:TctA family transporter